MLFNIQINVLQTLDQLVHKINAKKSVTFYHTHCSVHWLSHGAILVRCIQYICECYE